jgi:hypothetical protein
MGSPQNNGQQVVINRGWCLPVYRLAGGGGSGIRTHDALAGITVFKTVAFVHSAIPPRLGRGCPVHSTGIAWHRDASLVQDRPCLR